jgi:NADH pyrophosphatase NudC (nudix superfamily)
VDDQGSFEDTAISELRDEVGLIATKVNLVLSGAKQNPCRRIGGTWHYWHVYEANTKGDLSPSESETKGARWYTLDELSVLRGRTFARAAGTISEDEWIQQPGLEPVWCELLAELKIFGDGSGGRTQLPGRQSN